MKDLNAVLRDQDGIISRTQALALGWSRRQIDHLLHGGAWELCARGVYRVASHPFTERSALMAAVLWAGPQGVVVGRSAALLWGLPVEPPPCLQIAVPQSRAPKGMRIAVSRQFIDPREITVKDGVQVQSRQLAAISAAAELEKQRPGDGLAFFDRSLQTGVSHLAMVRAVERHPGFPGRRIALELLEITSGRSESEGERRTAKLMRDGGLTGWTPQLWVRLDGMSYRLDFGFAAERVAVEFDGFAFHKDQAAFVSDRRRLNALHRAGWQTVHVTWNDLITRPEQILEEIGAIVEMRRQDG